MASAASHRPCRRCAAGRAAAASRRAQVAPHLGDPIPKNNTSYRQLETTQITLNNRQSPTSKLHDLLRPALLDSNYGRARLVP
eukprot:scaffold6937_cov110-Isochrysis_galbana.AAC.2